jgi:hypothetical protein
MRRPVEPFRVPDGFWLREDVHVALRARDIAALFRLLQQARRVRRLIQQRTPTDAGELDDELNAFARALTAVATRAEL